MLGKYINFTITPILYLEQKIYFIHLWFHEIFVNQFDTIVIWFLKKYLVKTQVLLTYFSGQNSKHRIRRHWNFWRILKEIQSHMFFPFKILLEFAAAFGYSLKPSKSVCLSTNHSYAILSLFLAHKYRVNIFWKRNYKQ